jgi:cardiolipin synthase
VLAGDHPVRLVCLLLVVSTALGSVPAVVGGSSQQAEFGAPTDRAGAPTDRAAVSPDTTQTPTTDANTSTPTGSPRIVAVFPDPVADGDTGEYVVVNPGNASNLTLSDGETTVSVSPDAPVALSATPNATRSLVDVQVVEANLRLSNAGERLLLRSDGEVVDRLSYEETDEGERLNATTGLWTPRGLTPRSAVETGSATATAFVLPDAPDVPIETIREADERLLLAGYTFTSARAADALLAAVDRGVRVRVLLEGSPIGGMTTVQRDRLDRLVAGGVEVRVIAGPHDRFAYHHPKYLVADDEALVMTENWKPAGTGGRDSRGWGVRVDSAATADELAAVFAHDADGIDAVAWREHRRNASIVDGEAATANYDANFEPATVDITETRVLTAPGNAGGEIRESIAAADENISVLVPRIDPDGPYFAALVAAAERGVRVRLLLSNAWYDAESNRAVVDRVDRLRDRGHPIEARIARPAGRFGKVHAKGAIIDGETVLLGSLNWNEVSASENREVVLALDSTEAAAYYGETFRADWEAAGSGRSNGDFRVRLTLALGALAAVVLAGFILRRTVEFE